MKKFTIIRFEGSYAICEDETKALSKIPKYKLPLGCKENDCLIKDSDDMYQLEQPNTKKTGSKIK